MIRKLVIEIETNEVAEKTNFHELMDNLQDHAEETVKELIREDSYEHNYPFKFYAETCNEDSAVTVTSHWEN